jgi:hypothetical protein
LKRTAEDIIAIGQDLIAVKSRLGHGKFTPWLDSEFGMTDRHARNFMNVASRFGSKSEIISDLPVTVIYELASPSTPDNVIDMVEAGTISPTLPAIREAKQEVQQQTEAKPQESIGILRWREHHDTIPPIAPVVEPPARNEHVMQVMGSSESPEWYTPEWIVKLSIELLGEIDLDPCSNSHDTPSIPAPTRYTKEDDGLSYQWKGKTYFNPPYGSEIGKWIDKLVYEYEHGEVEEAIALLPARIDTIWFQPLYAYLMCNVRGRIQFANASNSAPFPCVIVYLGKREQDFIRVFKDKGPIMRRVG